MKYFGISDQFAKYVKLFFTDFSVQIQNGGYLSNPFVKTRSVNQGCCISPYLFLLCGKIMAHMIKLNKKIRGIKLGDMEMIISQFADDTTLFLEYNQMVLEEVIGVFSCIQENMGLKVSYEKTTIYRIGSLKDSDAKLYTSKNFTWSSGNIEMLGVEIENAALQLPKQYQKCIQKLENVNKNWYFRTLTLIGKVLLVNTLMNSIFLYKMMVLPDLSEQLYRTYENLIKTFIWNGKRAKIPLNILKAT